MGLWLNTCQVNFWTCVHINSELIAEKCLYCAVSQSWHYNCVTECTRFQLHLCVICVLFSPKSGLSTFFHALHAEFQLFEKSSNKHVEMKSLALFRWKSVINKVNGEGPERIFSRFSQRERSRWNKLREFCLVTFVKGATAMPPLMAKSISARWRWSYSGRTGSIPKLFGQSAHEHQGQLETPAWWRESGC